jgi:hypothetical protein
LSHLTISWAGKRGKPKPRSKNSSSIDKFAFLEDFALIKTRSGNQVLHQAKPIKNAILNRKGGPGAVLSPLLHTTRGCKVSPAEWLLQNP